MILQVRQPKRRIQARVLADDGQTVLDQPHGVVDGVLAPAPSLVARLQVALVRMDVVDRSLAEATMFVSSEPELEGVDDPPRKPFLEIEQVVRRAVVLVRPELRVGCGIDELCAHSQAASSLTNASLQHVSHAELARERLDVFRRALQRHR